MSRLDILVKEEFLGDVKNLIFPADVTLYVDGINEEERHHCWEAAKELDVVNLLNEQGIVFVIRQNNKIIKVAGAEQINNFIEEVFRTKAGKDISLENL